MKVKKGKNRKTNENGTSVRRSRVWFSKKNTADDPILKITMSQENTNG
jgi:hypothetical protein